LSVEQRWKRRQLVKELSTLYRVHADFDHIGVVKFYGATYQEGTAVIVLEYMNRGSLLSIIEEYGKIEEKFLKPIAKQVIR
jgi:serine/threonine protein kinase